jgi:hypothetical protein
MWREMAEALGWPDFRRVTFARLAALALNHSAGWASIGSEFAKWGRFKMGHGHPVTSNTGRLFFTLGVSAFSNSSNRGRAIPLTPEAVTGAASMSGIKKSSAWEW